MNVLAVLALLATLGMCGGCGKTPGSGDEAPGSGGVPGEPAVPTKAQPRLQTLKLWIGPEELTAELALSNDEVRTGMMFRKEIGENEGMLFVFGVPHQAAFWMKNTTVPLSAAYIDPQGVILEIHKFEPLNTNSVTASSSQVQYVLETAQGWFERHNIKPGTAIRTERGTLQETFFRRR